MKQAKPADRLREARKSAGFASAAEAARRIGVSPITYTAHENGTREYDREACLNYARRFHVSPAWLMFGADASGPAPTEENNIPLVDFTPGVADRTPRMLNEYAVLDSNMIADFTVDTLRLPSAFLDRQIYSKPTSLFAMEWKPSSRESSRGSEFRAGEILLVRSQNHGPPRGERYLVADGIFPDVFAIELHSRTDEGAFVVRAFSSTGGDKEIIKPLSEIKILGQVVATIKPL
ncbi:DNA-binding XRE family transcriptional regulator [Peteryoungia aggregata LMG 23059]|uniref:DNA-binding XRE family transcriptional regulator n=1 Tax=Peteryoungia aggregata LMG 23059 TaxID=1368425 RepID=A0ABU0GAH8_9HYPH|nr:helix-turn-helix domain-containing protein [Peteryoungia aggregata]MDQ0422359.1 DNA-binding XRE family transcriptional regulator [Peteryoungia aggregata LMG 23059]